MLLKSLDDPYWPSQLQKSPSTAQVWDPHQLDCGHMHATQLYFSLGFSVTRKWHNSSLSPTPHIRDSWITVTSLTLNNYWAFCSMRKQLNLSTKETLYQHLFWLIKSSGKDFHSMFAASHVLQRYHLELLWSQSHRWRGRSIGMLWAANQHLCRWACGFPRRVWAGKFHVDLRGIEPGKKIWCQGQLKLNPILLPPPSAQNWTHQIIAANAQRSSSWDSLDSDTLLRDKYSCTHLNSKTKPYVK